MNKMPLKMKLMMFGFMILFMAIYMFVFGAKNAVIGVMVVMAALMNLNNDLSSSPKLSFVKVTLLLLALGIASFLNNPISILGCILTFIIVFTTTITSYHHFKTSVYLPYLMCYFMMMTIPVSVEDLPMRLVSLICGVAFIVGINLLLNRKKSYKLTKSTVEKLSSELITAIDLKLKNEKVSKENFKVADGFYLSIFSNFQYKYFPSPKQESVINIIKAFQSIGWILAEYDLSRDELIFLKETLSSIEMIDSIDFHFKTKEFNLIVLNLEIIIHELQNNDLDNVGYDYSRINISKELFKNLFSFRSVKFTFAFKMAFILTLWEVLTLIFNLPFTKWLYFATIPLMLPYVNDMAENAKNRLKGTLIGVFIFAIIMILMSHIPLPPQTVIGIVLIICMATMVYKLENKLSLAISTTVLSVMVSLMYITPPEAFWLKILWVIVAIVGVSIINFGFLPYSVEKETKNNLKSSCDLNQKSIDLIKDKCRNNDNYNKTTLLVVSNLIRSNIEVTDENRVLYQIQARITDISNFILTYMDVYPLSKDITQKMIEIIENNSDFEDSNNINESIMLYSTKYLVKLFNHEKELL